ncbi:acyl carrier protein [Streptomyces tendae]|uniref:acyl carrier protein n=1 Tax=Streptomyces tendae TaxID=1932 RepID=UPI002490B7BD|nr:phosphopantetheine-binding protein [Streptomyces tendae]
MTRDEIIVEIINLTLRTAPDLEGGEVTADASFENLGLDSLTRIDLLAAVEKNFGLSVPDDKVGDLLRVSDVADFLMAYKAGV